MQARRARVQRDADACDARPARPVWLPVCLRLLPPSRVRRPCALCPVPCALCPRRDDAACSVFECVCPGPGTGSPWSAAGVLCSTRGKQDGDLCPPGARATPFLTSGSGQPGVRQGWRLEQRPRPGTGPELPLESAQPSVHRGLRLEQRPRPWTGPELPSGSGQPSVRRGWRLERRPRPGTSPELPSWLGQPSVHRG